MNKICLFGIVLSIFAFSSFLSVKAETVNLQITEVMANPLGDDTKLEWIEIMNISSTEENLSNWTLQGKPLPSFNISPGNIVVLVRDEQAFRTTFQIDTGLVKADFSLVNSAGDLVLQNINNNQTTTFSYESSEEGKSFERLVGDCNLIRKNDSSHTVGKVNTNCSILSNTIVPSIQPTVLYSTTSGSLPEIMFSSILPNPESGDEWIELFNNSNTDIDLDGFTIIDKTDKIYKITDRVIHSQEKLKIYPKTVSLNNEGDTISLLDKSLNRIDIIIYGESKKGIPFELLQGVSTESTLTVVPTLPLVNFNSTIKSTSSHLESNNSYFRVPIYYEEKDLE